MSKLAHSNDETMAKIAADREGDDRDEFTGHAARCRGGAADCTCSPGYLDDMAGVGEALIESINKNCPGWHPADSPVEIVVDLVNQRDDARKALAEVKEHLEEMASAGYSGRCLFCEKDSLLGHRDGCRIDDALAAIDPVPLQPLT